MVIGLYLGTRMLLITLTEAVSVAWKRDGNQTRGSRGVSRKQGNGDNKCRHNF